MAEIYALGQQKRAASDTSLVINVRGGKRPANNSFKLPLLQEQASSSKNTKKSGTRQPPRKIPVDLASPDVWEKLKSLDAGLTMAQWLALDKKAYAEVRDGLRFLHGRKARSNIQVDQAMKVNVLEVDSEEGDHSTSDEEEGTDWDSTWSKGSTFEKDGMNQDQENYNSDDTEYNYPYNLENMKKSIPLRRPIVIKGHVVQAVFDSGTSVSVISRLLVEKLKLTISGDHLAVSTMDDQSDQACEIIKVVPIRVAGKLRPKHMCVEASSNRDLCLLGYVELHVDHPDKAANIMSKNNEQSKEVFAVVVDLKNNKESSDKVKLKQDDRLKLKFYTEEIQGVKDKEEGQLSAENTPRELKVGSRRQNITSPPPLTPPSVQNPFVCLGRKKHTYVKKLR
ncbi:hypothetical protein INT45_006530 [Circinella minor]|uniref:Uncharacterized protein n=1 Tax=Circinella minor TaxID=1195481 RepID=A0A8H7RBJ2_9FUNG|nr:hypothetical protein INT45_006530 [Circinella minor]